MRKFHDNWRAREKESERVRVSLDAVITKQVRPREQQPGLPSAKDAGVGGGGGGRGLV